MWPRQSPCSGQAANDLADSSSFVWRVRADHYALPEARLDRLARLWRPGQLDRVHILKASTLDGDDVPLHFADSALLVRRHVPLVELDRHDAQHISPVGLVVQDLAQLRVGGGVALN
jgi:hypothetical protein